MTDRFTLVLLAIACWGSAAVGQSLDVVAPEAVGLSRERLDQLDSFLQGEVDRGALPGAVVMINRRGKLAHAVAIGYQNFEQHRAMRLDSIFRIYSMTKPLTSVAAMMLVEQGRLDLGAPLKAYLPEFAEMQVSVRGAGNAHGAQLVPANNPITILDLMRHTSGIAYGEIDRDPVIREAYRQRGLYHPDGPEYDLGSLTPEQEIAALAAVPLASEPGTNWEYSLSTDLLGRVIERITGQSLGQFMADHLFRPLQMKDAGFFVGPEQRDRLAEPLAFDPTSEKPNRLIDVTRPPVNDSGGGGAVATAGDYLNFASMLLERGRWQGKIVLAPMTIDLMTEDQLGNRTTLPRSPGQLAMRSDGFGFGLGFMVRETSGPAAVPASPGEFSWSGAAGTFFWVDPEIDLAVVIMMQSPGPSRAPYWRIFKQMIAASILDKSRRPVESK